MCGTKRTATFTPISGLQSGSLSASAAAPAPSAPPKSATVESTDSLARQPPGGINKAAHAVTKQALRDYAEKHKEDGADDRVGVPNGPQGGATPEPRVPTGGVRTPLSLMPQPVKGAAQSAGQNLSASAGTPAPTTTPQQSTPSAAPRSASAGPAGPGDGNPNGFRELLDRCDARMAPNRTAGTEPDSASGRPRSGHEHAEVCLPCARLFESDGGRGRSDGWMGLRMRGTNAGISQGGMSSHSR